jgi:hypothetical protein
LMSGHRLARVSSATSAVAFPRAQRTITCEGNAADKPNDAWTANAAIPLLLSPDHADKVITLGTTLAMLGWDVLHTATHSSLQYRAVSSRRTGNVLSLSTFEDASNARSMDKLNGDGDTLGEAVVEAVCEGVCVALIEGAEGDGRCDELVDALIDG